jgi:hypothetical protein
MLEEEVETEPEIPPDDSPASDAQRTLDDPEDKPIPKEDIVRKKLENLPEMKKYTRLYHKYCKGVFNSIGTNSFAMLQLHTDLSILEDTTNRELAECFHPFFMFVVYSCIDRYICDLRRQIETEEKEIYLNYYREKIKSPTIVRNLAITEIVLGILGGAAIAVLALEKLINIRSIFFMSLSGICALFLITGVLVAAVSTAIIKKRKNVQEQNLGVIKTVDNCIYFD